MGKIFKQILIGSLYRPRGVAGWTKPELILTAIKTGAFSAVVTEGAKVLGFMVSLEQMREVLAHEDNQLIQPEEIAQSELTKNPWQAFCMVRQHQIVKVTFRGWPRFALISPNLQNYLDLPLVGIKEVI